MLDAWATQGPSDALADVVAGIIIADPGHNPYWIAKWQAWPQERIVEPGRCLLERDDDLVGRLAEITCPALVIHGSEDTAIPLSAAGELAASLPGADGRGIFEGAPHASNLTHPDQVNPPLLAFLRML